MRHAHALLMLSLLGVLACVPAAEAKRAKRPVVKSVTPLRASVGEVMTVQGRRFIPGYGENVVVLISKDKRVRYVRSENSTNRTITIRVPDKVERLLDRVNGERVATRFRVKVITKRMGRPSKRAVAKPTIGPDVGGDCDNDGIPNPSDNDDDNDVLPDSIELTIRTDPCVADSDGDKLLDGWEYLSALDLNHNALPYPGKRPYPNALFADATIDYDGDGLPAWAEHTMWWLGGKSYPLSYSDGNQHSVDRPTGSSPWDMMRPLGKLSDDERDFDKDGIANILELRGTAMTPWPNYPGIDRPHFLQPDSDGDGLPDGADDQDHDGVSNVDELTTGTWAMNPCDPMNLAARACPRWMDPDVLPERPKHLCTSVTLLSKPIRWLKEEPSAEITPEHCDGPIERGSRDR